MTKKLLGKVDVKGYEKEMKYVNRKGEVWTADRRQPLSPEEKDKREKERKKLHDEANEERAITREGLRKAKEKARKCPTVENATAYEEAKMAYEEVMGRG